MKNQSDCRLFVCSSSVATPKERKTIMESKKTAYAYLVTTIAFALCFFALCEAPVIVSLF